MDESTPSLPRYLEQLRIESGASWDHIIKAWHCSLETRQKIREIVDTGSLIPTDCSLILFGSLARGECTRGSDCDWTLLVDGPASRDHHHAAVAIRDEFESASLAAPGSTGVFGNLSFSHDLVHQIGGQEDTNMITTRRVLMLLESVAVPVANSEIVRARVVRQVVGRYVDEPEVSSTHSSRLPRFLLNDVVRYWRTMTVDYARKVRDHNADGWALRNIKLRLSRKLTFVSGLLTCMDGVFNPQTTPEEPTLYSMSPKRLLTIQEHVLKCADTAPLELLAKAVYEYSKVSADRSFLACELFDSYNDFLGMLDDEDIRLCLKSLSHQDARNDKSFQTARQAGQQFQKGLLRLFFETDNELSKATQEYGVF